MLTASSFIRKPSAAARWRATAIPAEINYLSSLDYGNGDSVQYTYDAWGNPLSVTGSLAATLGNLNPLHYRGYVYDTESGLYYLQSRYYNPEMGRLINADAAVATGQGLTGKNMFAYCGNNPVCRIDPNEVRRDTQHWSCKYPPGT